MFDNLPFVEPVGRRAAPGRVAVGLAVGLAAGWLAWNAAAARPVAVISAANHLRQIEGFSSGAATRFYVCNAGFHSRRQRLLIATIRLRQ